MHRVAGFRVDLSFRVRACTKRSRFETSGIQFKIGPEVWDGISRTNKSRSWRTHQENSRPPPSRSSPSSSSVHT